MADKGEILGSLRVLGLEFWGVSIGLGYIGWSVASNSFYPTTKFILASIILGPLLGSFTFLINNSFDKKFDSQNPRKIGSPIVSGKLSTKNALNLSFLSALFAVLFSFFLGIQFFFLSLCMIIIAYIYSAYPIRLKERPCLDLLSTSVGLGILCPLAGYSIEQSIVKFPTWYLLAIFLIMAGLYPPTTVADHNTDILAGVRTFAVYFGKKKAIFIGVFLFAFGHLIIVIESLFGYVLSPQILTYTWTSYLLSPIAYFFMLKFNSHDDIIKFLFAITILEIPGPLFLSALNARVFVP